MIRLYTPDDYAACLAIFDSNMPKFVDPSERSDFESFLNTRAVETGYLVVTESDSVIACGGLTVPDTNGTAYFSWGLVDRKRHGQGIGRKLAEARLEAARQTGGIHKVAMDTSQLTFGFYEKFGFRTTKVTKNGYGPALDRYDMELSI